MLGLMKIQSVQHQIVKVKSDPADSALSAKNFAGGKMAVVWLPDYPLLEDIGKTTLKM